jgi:hypothetical protein
MAQQQASELGGGATIWPRIDYNEGCNEDCDEDYLIESLWYKLHLLGVPIEGPTNVFYDHEVVCKNTTKLEAVLK